VLQPIANKLSLLLNLLNLVLQEYFMSVSINKYIGSSGYCSRREADLLIDAGRVELNGKRAFKTDEVYEGDEVVVDGLRVAPKKKMTYILFNKPVGVTCTTDLKDKSNIIDFINHPNRIFPIGRLDKDSSGLILLTDDGDIVNHILREENYHEKEYLVFVRQGIEKDFARQMSSGKMIIDKVQIKPCKIKVLSKHSFSITLTQGLNRQIRKMCSVLGYTVYDLQRIRIMKIHLGNLKLGKWRNLSEVEVKGLMDKRS
jgi:23S rRNA pseudouridine2604 synthase